MKTTTIYCFSQQCVQAGMVVPTSKLDDYRAGTEDQSDDIFAAYAGTEDDIRVEAAADAKKYSGFNGAVARNVLRYVGG